MLRWVVFALVYCSCSVALTKKAPHVVFVSSFNEASTKLLANVAKELRNKDASCRVTLFTYSSYSNSLYKYLRENETNTFNYEFASFDPTRKILQANVSSTSSLGHFPSFLDEISDSYDAEIDSLKGFTELNKPDVFVVDMYSVR